MDDTFVVISGDALTDIDLTSAIDFHIKKGAIATLILKRVDIPLEYGVVVTDEEGKVTRFIEKPSWGEVFSDTVNTGKRIETLTTNSPNTILINTPTYNHVNHLFKLKPWEPVLVKGIKDPLHVFEVLGKK